MDMFKQLFQVGDIIQSDLDKPVLIVKVINRNGYYFYTCLRQLPEDIAVNGTLAHYNQLSLAGFKVVGHNPVAEVLYSTKKF